MLERYVELNMCVNAVLAECGRRELVLSGLEQQTVKELCTLLGTSPNDLGRRREKNPTNQPSLLKGPFHEATKELSGEAYPTLSIVLPLINGLIFALRRTTVTNPQVLEIQNSLLTDLTTRWKDTTPAVILATVSDPRTKNGGPFWSENQLPQAWFMLRKILCTCNQRTHC
jgi:hypothetical protein